ncbi:MAG TPA: hypothetical protein VK203_24235 [Nostocaceae cyanobacterium]|nr:hypothetical protein [Nostocaceae cyanobacterium]
MAFIVEYQLVFRRYYLPNMTQSNLPTPPQKKQKFSWPVWFPYPSSWVRSLIILIFFSLITRYSGENIVKSGYEIAYYSRSPEALAIFTLILLLFPIPLITFIHHSLHTLISQVLPGIKSREISRNLRILPGVISIWEGLLAWLVIVLSTLTALLISSFILPVFNVNYSKPVEYYTNYQETIIYIFGFLWITTGAYIYQIEFLFKRQLISTHSVREKLVKNQENPNRSKLDEIKNEILEMTGQTTRLQTPANLSERTAQKTQLQAEFIAPETTVKNNQEIQIRIKKKWLIYSLIPLVAISVFLFSKIINLQNFTPQPQVAANQSLPSSTINTTPTITTSPTITPQIDNFREAVNKAINAANLTQTAKSKAEWNNVVNEWQTAINLMKTVPASSPNYVVAQQKIIQYQKNMNYAETNATNIK